MSKEPFIVEGRYFPNSLYAFTFAQIQADRMQRPVEVQVHDPYDCRPPVWHATAHPPGTKRVHTVKQPPGLITAAA